MAWCEIIGRPKSFAIWLLVPIVGFFIFAEMASRMVRSFGKMDLKHSAGAIAYTPASFFWLAFNKDAKYQGPVRLMEKEYMNKMAEAKAAGKSREFKKLNFNNPYKKTAVREWVESIFFAVFAAAFIRMFLIEAYVIPTPSMEGSLLVGDFLFVSKAHYGIRTPMTVAMLPLLHNRVPIINRESYFESPSLPYKRLKAIEPIDVNDPIVFNWPVGDSILLTSRRSYTVNQVARDPKNYFAQDRELRKKFQNKDIITRPLDKKDHYIKRCLAGPGDSLQIIDRQVYLNGEALENPKDIQFLYLASFSRNVSLKRAFKKLNIFNKDLVQNIGNNKVLINLSESKKNQVMAYDPGAKIEIFQRKWDTNSNEMFPHDPKNYPGWTQDNYGPIWIPKKGETVDINLSNLSMFSRVINVYENNDIEVKSGKIYINGEEANSYTFKQDYYWAMGDNRHNSEDSRAWGFVPEDHIVGKPLFIWFSTENGSIANGIRWNRLFKSADIF